MGFVSWRDDFWRWADDHGELVVLGYVAACALVVLIGALVWSVTL